MVDTRGACFVCILTFSFTAFIGSSAYIDTQQKCDWEPEVSLSLSLAPAKKSAFHVFSIASCAEKIGLLCIGSMYRMD